MAEKKQSRRLTFLMVLLLSLAIVLGGRTLHRKYEVEALRHDCQVSQRGENWRELLHHAERWTAIEPQNDDAWIYLATAKRFTEDWEGFVSAVENLPPTNPFYIPSLQAVGDVLIDETKDIRRAEQIFLQILSLDPNNHIAYQRLTFLYSMTLQNHKLHYVLRESIRRGEATAETYVYLTTLSSLNFSNGLFRVAQWKTGTSDYWPLESAHKVYLARAKPTQANRMVRRLDASIAAYEDTRPGLDLLRENPANPCLLAFYIELAMEVGDSAVVGKYLSLWPDDQRQDFRYWRYRGWHADMEDQLDLSLECYEKAVSIHPMDWKSRDGLAMIQRSLGAPEAGGNAELAVIGKDLTREMLELPTGNDISASQLSALGQYAKRCGDTMVSEGITKLITAGRR
ncbi:MAG: hypothetical protein R3C05_04985 [Pirellulaceae bacterium]